MRKKLLSVILGLASAAIINAVASGCVTPVSAVAGVSMSPMNQKMTLVPGETQCGTFTVSNGATNTETITYGVTIEPIFINESGQIIYDKTDSYNEIVDWTTISKTEGSLAPNESNTIEFCIDVPTNAPAGGQYVAFRAVTKDKDAPLEGGVNINVSYGVAHIVLAEIAGTTVREGQITNMSVPSFLLSGELTASSTVQNTGNVHDTASYTLQVFPLFSDEEVYTNEEDPETKNVFPERSLTNVSTWDETPQIGIFNVIYTVEFAGVTNQVKKMVIICPIWLLVILLAVIILIIFLFASKIRKNKK